jgi:hypothetical protein
MNSLCRFTVSEPYGLEGTLKACPRALAAGPARCFWPPHLHAYLSKAAGLWSFSGPAKRQLHAFNGKIIAGNQPWMVLTSNKNHGHVPPMPTTRRTASAGSRSMDGSDLGSESRELGPTSPFFVGKSFGYTPNNWLVNTWSPRSKVCGPLGLIF